MSFLSIQNFLLLTILTNFDVELVTNDGLDKLAIFESGGIPRERNHVTQKDTLQSSLVFGQMMDKVGMQLGKGPEKNGN